MYILFWCFKKTGFIQYSLGFSGWSCCWLLFS